MSAFVGEFLEDCFFPEDFSVFAIDRQYREFLMTYFLEIVMGAMGVESGWGFFFTKGDGCGDEDVVLPDDGRGVAFAWDWSFPSDVFVFAPFDWRVGVGGDAGGQGAAPLGPIMLWVGIVVCYGCCG